MKTSEYAKFGELLAATFEVYGAKATPGALEIWVAALAPYQLADVRNALSAHIQTPGSGKFAPKPADLITILQGMDGRPSAEESWARLSHAIGDENATVVLTDEERVAFFVADQLGDDKIAARMAFKESYAKAMQDARREHRPVKWSPILGHNAAAREAALVEAERLGRLPAAYVAGLLPHRNLPAPEVQRLIDKGQA